MWNISTYHPELGGYVEIFHLLIVRHHKIYREGVRMLWDVFISHASEDKAEVARPLADALQSLGLRVWLDEQQLTVGDSLSRKINDGLSLSRFGVLILSREFLEKDYPQREMQALLARQTATERYILPVLHKVDHSILKRSVPLLGDLLSVSTDAGIHHVATSIHRAVAGLPRQSGNQKSQRYFESLPFPTELVDAALSAIGTLHTPSRWVAMTPLRDMSVADIWMGTDNPEFVSMLYALYAPLIHFTKHRYRFERTLTTLRPTEQVRFLMLDSAVNALSKDLSVAAAAPRLSYSPRVSGWRHLRAAEPAKYWWQGLTRERIQDAVPVFYETTDPEALPSFGTFRRAHDVGYRAFCGGQQTLGLLANPLYGFTPATRPVYWRVLALWHCFYTMLCQTPAEASAQQLRHLLLHSPWTDAAFPTYAIEEHLRPEPEIDTRQAVRGYVLDHVYPGIRELLSEPSA